MTTLYSVTPKGREMMKSGIFTNSVEAVLGETSEFNVLSLEELDTIVGDEVRAQGTSTREFLNALVRHGLLTRTD